MPSCNDFKKILTTQQRMFPNMAHMLCAFAFMILIALIAGIYAHRKKITHVPPDFVSFSAPFLVYYINIDNRTDRNAHFLREMQKIQCDGIVRVPAVEHKIGILGCIQSHIKVLKMCLYDDNEFALICEDDFTFKGENREVQFLLQQALSTCIEWNVILLAVNGKTKPTSFKYIHKVIHSQTASAYLIKKVYVPVLLALWENTYAKTGHLKKKPPHDLCLDICWKQLQHDKWYAVNPTLGYQYKSYSNIENRVVEYRV